MIKALSSVCIVERIKSLPNLLEKTVNNNP